MTKDNRVVAYKLVRIMPCSIAGEFINVGVVTVDGATGEIDYAGIDGFSQRAEDFFGEKHKELFINVQKNLIEHLQWIQGKVTEGSLQGRMQFDELTRLREGPLQYSNERVTIKGDCSAEAILRTYAV